MRTAPYSPAWSTRIMDSISAVEPGAVGLGLRGMLATQQKSAGTGDQEGEDGIVSWHCQSEQEPSGYIATYRRFGCAAAHCIGMVDGACLWPGQQMILY